MAQIAYRNAERVDVRIQNPTPEDMNVFWADFAKRNGAQFCKAFAAEFAKAAEFIAK